MPGGWFKMAYRYRSLTGVAVILALLIYGGISESAAAAPDEPVLQLKPETNRFPAPGKLHSTRHLLYPD
jgi:hypothetical protein